MAGGSATARVQVIAEVEAYAKALSALPGITDKEAAKAALRLEDRIARAQVRAAEQASRVAATAAKKTSDELAEVADRLAGVNKVSQIFGGVLGPLGGALDDTGDLMEKFGASTAAYALGGGAAVAVLAAEAAAAVKLATAANQVVREWDSYVSAAGYAEDITARYGVAVDAAREAQEGADRSTARLALTLGGELAPAIAAVHDAWGGAATVIEEVITAISDAAQAASEWRYAEEAQFIAGSALRAQFPLLASGYDIVTTSLGALVDLGHERNETLQEEARLAAEASRLAQISAQERAREASQLAELLGVPAQEPVAQDREQQAATKRRADQARAAREQQVRQAQEAAAQLSQITDRYLGDTMDAEAKIIEARNTAIEQIDHLERVSGQHAEAELARSLAEEAALRDLAALRSEAAAQFVADVEKQRAAEAKAEAQRMAALEHQRQEQEKQAEAQQAAQEAYRSSQLGAAGSIVALTQQATNSLIDMMDTPTDGGRNAALALFAVNKGVAVADIAVKTAQATMAALTIPPPAGPILAGANIAAGAIAAAAALAAQPQFHAGRVLQSDETVATLQKSEVVIPAAEVSRQGGPQGVAERLRGGGGGQTIVLRADFSDRSLMVPLARETRAAGGTDPLYGWARG